MQYINIPRVDFLVLKISQRTNAGLRIYTIRVCSASMNFGLLFFRVHYNSGHDDGLRCLRILIGIKAVICIYGLEFDCSTGEIWVRIVMEQAKAVICDLKVP